ncbi:unnamed protein product [Candidula unifasciata]|uniref:Ig-like domain-containing protein n=1 Tax=Candidula unifasciata TaxID=100452 RepID=A0A8S3Z350_9EUPU|nr:unnamed protein product [Candidula unifasciata]
MEMKCLWAELRFIIIGCLTAVKCQKSQHLVLSEPRRTGVEGTALQVNCTANVTSSMDSLKWIPVHEGQSGIQQSLVTNTTVVMTIPSLQGSDAGRYKCLLVMSDGREETTEFELMVRRKEANSAACSITQFKCKKTKHCIFLRYRCDGKDDCGDGSDEDCESDPCLNKFRCNNSRCIDTQEVCNHIDNCGDRSDEATICFLGKFMSTTQSVTEDNQFGWLKITMSTVIASTVGAVILISFIVIVVFRVKMKRQREQRISRALEGMYRHGESREATSSGQGDEAAGDQRPFLPSGSCHYGNIIVNVNNGVQYLPGYDYSLFVGVPPPYSECSGGDLKSQPPPYSTIDRSNSRQQACVSQPSEAQPDRQSLSVSSVQNCLAGVRGPEHLGIAVPGHSEPCSVVFHGGSQVQDLESLSGITPKLLQSLLGSHCEAAPDTDGYRSSFHSLPASADCWPTRGQVGHILPSRVGLMASHSLARPAPRTTCSSTQTSQQKSLVSTDSGQQVAGAESRPGGQDKFVSNRSIAPNVSDSADGSMAQQVAVGQDTLVVERDNTVGSVDVPAMSRGVYQVPVSDFLDTYEAAPNNPCTLSSLVANGGSDFDDLIVPLLGCSQDEESLSDKTCSVRKPVDGLNSAASVMADITDCFRLADTETAPGCIASVNEVTCGSEDRELRPGQLCRQNDSSPADNSALLAAAAGSPLLVTAENGIRFESLLPTVCADLPTRKAGWGSQLLLNDGTIAPSLQQSSTDQSSGSSLGVDASITPSDSCNITGSKHPSSGELNVLLLQTSRQTASSQILSGLTDVYAAEQPTLAHVSIEPVVNTKRPTGVVTRPALPKFNSDFALPHSDQPS